MKFTLNWLKDHLDTNASLDEVAQKLTAVGLEVEEVIDQAAELSVFTVAEIQEATQHPNADRLRVCKVNTGSEILQIVCGAPNARAGIKVALAKVGTTIPTNGLKIKASKIRDIDSSGMLCSARELGLGEDHDGIIELPQDATTGDSIVGVLGLDDPVIDIAITPNRADCTGVRGIARDLAAAGLGTLKPLKSVQWDANGKSEITVSIEDKGCHQFIGCHITGVTNTPSPAWLQQRLKAIGLRPISALVDITNYITFDLGRPLHVYDANKLQGNIVVRQSRKGESFEALNDKQYTVGDANIAIADDSGLIGLGGIIGGTSTGCELDTTNVFLEVAYFEPSRIAATGRTLQVDSDARFRFERGIDPAFLEEGAKQAVRMVLELCGGKASELTYAGEEAPWKRTIDFDPAYTRKIGGVDISEAEQKRILESLGFSFNGQAVTPPSWRADIEGRADLAEEILRIYGYDNIPDTLLPKLPTITGNILTPMQQRTATIRKSLAANGLVECKTWSFLAWETAQHFGGQKESLRLVNPISSELDTMRPSLLPNLIQAVTANKDRGTSDQQLFETGLQFHDLGQKGQRYVTAAVQCGMSQPRSHYKNEHQFDCFDAKALAFTIVEAAGFDPEQLQVSNEAPEWYHPGRSGQLRLGKNVIGYFGEIHPAVLKAMDAPRTLVGCEIFVESIPLAKKKSATKPALAASAYQAVQRDFAFVADRKLAANDLLRAVQGSDKKLIQTVQLFDVYEGEHIDADKKSIALSVTLQSADETLTEDQIDAVSRKVIENVGKLGAKLRA